MALVFTKFEASNWENWKIRKLCKRGIRARGYQKHFRILPFLDYFSRIYLVFDEIKPPNKMQWCIKTLFTCAHLERLAYQSERANIIQSERKLYMLSVSLSLRE